MTDEDIVGIIVMVAIFMVGFAMGVVTMILI